MRGALTLAWLLLGNGCVFLYSVAPPLNHHVLQGGLTAEMAFSCVASDNQHAVVYGFDLRNQQVRVTRCSTLALVHWQTHGDAFWLVEKTAKKNRWGVRPVWAAILWYELAPLLKGDRVRGPAARPDNQDHLGFAGCDPVEDTWTLAECWCEFPPVVHYDIAPIMRTSTRLFLLTNVGGRVQSQGATDRLVESALHMPPKDRTIPRWSFTCYTTSSRWNPDNRQWQGSDWRREFSLECGFQEPFHALSQGNDHYFLTETGRLFRAARPVKGTFRKMETTYANRDRPVTVFLTDADTGRVFLFRRAVADRGKPSVAELAPRLTWREYDPAIYRPGGNGPTELRQVVGYARVLQALGLIPTATPNRRR